MPLTPTSTNNGIVLTEVAAAILVKNRIMEVK
jgi:hypothetical protein